jgi:hypothetical protein
MVLPLDIQLSCVSREVTLEIMEIEHLKKCIKNGLCITLMILHLYNYPVFRLPGSQNIKSINGAKVSMKCALAAVSNEKIY